MTRMRAVTQCIENPDIQPLKSCGSCSRQSTKVTGIGQVAEAKAHRCDVSVLLRERQGRNRAPFPLDDYRLVRLEPVLGDDWRILTARRGAKAISESRMQGRGGGLIKVDVDAPVLAHHQRTKIVNPMRMIGMLVREHNAVEPIHLRGEKLLAQIRRCVDKHTRDAAGAAALEKKRRASAPVLGIGGVAVAPAERRARDPARRSTSQDRELQHGRESAAGRGTLAKSRKKFSLVCMAISSSETPRAVARACAVAAT